MSDDELAEALREILRALQTCMDNAVIADMETELAAGLSERISVTDTTAVLFGYEGQVDKVMQVPQPHPNYLRLPIPPARRNLLASDDDCLTPHLRTAEYQRVAPNMYVRTE